MTTEKLTIVNKANVLSFTVKPFAIIFMITTLLLSSCGFLTHSDSPPADVLPEKQMVSILSDICLVEARFQRRLTVKGATNEELAIENYVGIFRSYGITTEQFKKSYQYYTEHPEVMEKIFEQVIIVLDEQKTTVKADTTLN